MEGITPSPPPEVNIRNDTPPPRGEGTPRGRGSDHHIDKSAGILFGSCIYSVRNKWIVLSRL
jgi:hypothetical protein